jgi:type I restriction enzyme M protein
MFSKLAPTGRAGFVLANGSLSTQTGGEGEIRKRMIKDYVVECIVSLPPQLFYSTQIPVSLWFLSRRKERPGEILFIDARKLGYMEDRVHKALSDADIARIAGTCHAWRTQKDYSDVPGFCKAATLKDVEAQDFILTPGRYVGLEAQEEDVEDFEEKMARLTGELAELFEKSHRMEEEIRKQLGGIGYEF